MKKYFTILLALFCTIGLFGCNNTTTISESKSEIVSIDYGKVIELAKAEFAEIFKELENIQIDEASTMIRTDDAKQIVVQIKYSSSNGSGVYGFELDCNAEREKLRAIYEKMGFQFVKIFDEKAEYKMALYQKSVV